MNADLWPHVWIFNWWCNLITAVCPWDILNPHAYLEAMEPDGDVTTYGYMRW